MLRLFCAADLDGGGSLDRSEMRQLARSLGVTDEAALQEATHQMDADGARQGCRGNLTHSTPPPSAPVSSRQIRGFLYGQHCRRHARPDARWTPLCVRR